MATAPVEAVAQPTSFSIVPSAWHAASEVGSGKPVLKFDDRYGGFPDGIMTSNEAVAVSNNAHFASGTINFDIKPLAYSDTGVIFRRDVDGNGEFFYLRRIPTARRRMTTINTRQSITGCCSGTSTRTIRGPPISSESLALDPVSSFTSAPTACCIGLLSTTWPTSSTGAPSCGCTGRRSSTSRASCDWTFGRMTNSRPFIEAGRTVASVGAAARNWNDALGTHSE